jgi:pimeloyl-ACP methyl ester carboxylesterase
MLTPTTITFHNRILFFPLLHQSKQQTYHNTNKLLLQRRRRWNTTNTINNTDNTLITNNYRTTNRGLTTLAATLTLGTLTVASAFFFGTAAYGSYVINRSRTRWFSDRFVLTPESLRMPYRKIDLITEDDITLEGWWIEQTIKGRPSDRIVLCACPYNHDKSTLLAIARALWDSGHSVLLFDFRAFGPTKSPQETIGYLELRDARAAIQWLRTTKREQAKIGVMGCSMGGAVVLRLVEEDDTDVVGVATDCAFANLKDVVHSYVKSCAPSRFPDSAVGLFVDTISLFNSLMFGYTLESVGPEIHLSKLKVPLFVLHSGDDSVVPTSQAYKIINGASTPPEYKKILLVHGIDHIGSFFTDEITYTRNLITFLDQCFNQYQVVQQQQQLHHSTSNNNKSV